MVQVCGLGLDCCSHPAKGVFAGRGSGAAAAGELSPLRGARSAVVDSTTDAISRCLQQRETRKVLEASNRFQKQLEAELLELMQQKASPG
jgi:hypothetical protein